MTIRTCWHLPEPGPEPVLPSRAELVTIIRSVATAMNEELAFRLTRYALAESPVEKADNAGAIAAVRRVQGALASAMVRETYQRYHPEAPRAHEAQV